MSSPWLRRYRKPGALALLRCVAAFAFSTLPTVPTISIDFNRLQEKTMNPFAHPSSPRRSLAFLPLVLVALALTACGKQGNNDAGTTPGSTGSGAAPAAVTGTEAARTPSTGDSPAGGSSGFKGSVPSPDASGGPSTGGTNAPGGGSAAGAAGPGATANPPAAGASGASGTTTNGGLPGSQTGSIATPGGSTNSTPNSSTGNASR
jgi:hypothetical protein